MLCEQGTTFSSLAKDYENLEINKNAIKLMQFEEFANRIRSAETLDIVKALLDSLETRLTLSRSAVGSSKSSLHDINHLLKRLAPQKRMRAVQDQPKQYSRYPVRLFLCAYMILGHPDAVFNQRGEHEVLLSEAAVNLTREFELLIKMIVDGNSEKYAQLETFDTAWCSYLYRFVVWKIKDARSLEDELVRIACEMELSMMQTCKLSVDGGNQLTSDMKAVRDQVIEDHKLLREKVLHLTGDAGVQRMEFALSDTRSRYFEAKENERVNNVSSQPGGVNASSCPNSSEVLLTCPAKNSLPDNEVLVNEVIHEYPYALTERLDVSKDGQNDMKARIKDTVEKAFWDGVTESLNRDKPDYGRIVDLVKEVRDELCKMAPKSWEKNIFDSIDVDILSQVLKSGSRDLGYLGKILEYALDTLRKLSSAATEDEMIKTHKILMSELGEISQAGEEAKTSFVIATVKGLRFVLEQTQVLKREISKARIKIQLESIARGPAGFEYLRKAFNDHYGSPLGASNSLPVTVEWLLSVRSTLDKAWKEHTDSLSGLSTSHGVPQTKLQTGGRIYAASQQASSGSPISTTTAGNHQPECTGTKVDKLVRLGLLKLICRTEAITGETVPETLKLNLSRLRKAQDQLEIIIITSISILCLRQTLISENLAKTAADIEKAVCISADRLTQLLDRVKDVGIMDIVETVIQSFDDDSGKIQSRKAFMANMLLKSLRAGDPVFDRVSGAVQLAARGVMFGGSGLKGKELAETELRRIGAAVLTEKLIKAVEILILVATVSQNVHGPWYSQILV